ncbi:60S ribosomal protein L7a-2-like [Lactuca sativa]|uniref:60S ribosomal protein L7a-2-like n=1 Tax=Lactuca sativa TaxID=4236 RepID=UPI000CD8D6D6|nr:60S ribosomal protein L7a-2-like [Lactuca sativa]
MIDRGEFDLNNFKDGKAAKKEQLLKRAQAESEGKSVEAKKPIVVTYGLNHITYLIEQVVVRMLKEEGIRSFYKGLVPSLIRIAPYVEATFACIIACDGVAGLYRGFVPNALKTLPNSRRKRDMKGKKAEGGGIMGSKS